MEKEFVPYELALELKELGFDEPCFGFCQYKNGKIKHITTEEGNYNNRFHKSTSDFFWVSAPLYQQAFRWFREKYNIEHNNSPAKKFKQDKSREISIYIDGFFISNLRFTLDKTYEAAELECLKKLIEIVKNK